MLLLGIILSCEKCLYTHSQTFLIRVQCMLVLEVRVKQLKGLLT